MRFRSPKSGNWQRLAKNRGGYHGLCLSREAKARFLEPWETVRSHGASSGRRARPRCARLRLLGRAPCQPLCVRPRSHVTASQSKGSGGLARGCATAATVGCLPRFHHPGPVAMVPVQLRARCSGKRRTQLLRRRSLYGASVVCCGCLFANLSNTRAPTLSVGTMRTLSRLEADAHDAYVNLTCRR